MNYTDALISEFTEDINTTNNKVIYSNDMLPAEIDFEKIIDRQKKFQAKGKDAGWMNTPWGQVVTLKDKNKAIKRLIVSILAGWDELTEKLIAKCEELGYSKTELGQILKSIDPRTMTYLQNLCNKFSLEAKITENLREAVEKHDKLNPKIFQGNKLKSKVHDQILNIVDTFIEELADDDIKIDIEDIVLIGSNVSYNYNDKSDLDVHIIANLDKLNCPDNLYPLIYSAYRSLFNKKFDIDFYGIPVELFVEVGDVPTVSNGIYSVKKDAWIKEPIPEDIPEVNQNKLDTMLDKWETKANDIIKTSQKEKDPSQGADQIVQYIEDIYELRKNGLIKTGEYGIENLTFKEIRNKGLLDKLKELKNQLIAKSLSL